MNDKILQLLVLLFAVFLLASYTFSGGGFLVDSIGFHFYTPLEKQFADPNIHSRPLAGFLKTWLSYFSYNRYVLIAIFSIVNLLTYFIFYIVLVKTGIAKTQSLLITLLSFIFVYSTSTMFSPVMVVSSVPIAILFVAIYFIHKNKNWAYFVAGILLFITTLIYEINLFLLPVLMFLFFQKNSFKDLIYRGVFVLIMPVILMFLFKNYLAYFIFDGYGAYTDNKTVISIKNILDAFVSIFKTYCLDTIFILKRGISNISHFNGSDCILGLLMVVISVLVYKIPNHKFLKITITQILLFIILFILSHGIFFVSTYKANAYDFENRVLGLPRFSWALLMFAFFSLLIKSKFGNIFKLIFSVLILSFGLTLISQKNAWLYADTFNEKLVKSFINIYPKNPLSNRFFIQYDKSKVNNYLVNDEPLPAVDYEFSGLLKFYKFTDYNKIKVTKYQPKDYNIDYLFGRKLNKRFKSEIKLKESYPNEKKVIEFPFYLYNYNENKLFLINDESDYNKIIKQ
ncbi:MAG: hypothetical protein Q4G16_01440 [Cruoricaptor ignavus]|nr:hypothetical protein [Cruoricaptor ignavus]